MTETTRAVPAAVHPLVGAAIADPYPLFEEWRANTPVFYHEGIHAFVVTRYRDVREVVARADIFSSANSFRDLTSLVPEARDILAAGLPQTPVPLNSDGREHRRLRAPLNRALSPRRVAAMEGRIRAICTRLIHSMRSSRRVDFVSSFAWPLPVEVIMWILSVPQGHMSDCKRWSDDVHAILFEPLSPQRQVECAASLVAFKRLCLELVELRRREPRDDFITVALDVQVGDEPPPSDVELANTLVGTLLAGHETTTHALTTTLLILLDRPGAWRGLAVDPATIPAVIEEVLRYDAPAQSFFRHATVDTEVGGVQIPAGSSLLVVYGAANRDGDAFPEPDSFEPRRRTTRHLAFGHGPHTCPGAGLARLELRVALEELTTRLPALRIPHDQHIPFCTNIVLRGATRLEVDLSS
jgi:cytochrome P450